MAVEFLFPMLVATRSLLSRIHFKSMAAFHWGLEVPAPGISRTSTTFTGGGNNKRTKHPPISPWNEALAAGSEIAGDEMARRRECRETLSRESGRAGVKDRVLKGGSRDGSLETAGASDVNQVEDIIAKQQQGKRGLR